MPVLLLPRSQDGIYNIAIGKQSPEPNKTGHGPDTDRPRTGHGPDTDRTRTGTPALVRDSPNRVYTRTFLASTGNMLLAFARNVNVYIYIYTYTYIHIYIYIYGLRDLELPELGPLERNVTTVTFRGIPDFPILEIQSGGTISTRN